MREPTFLVVAYSGVSIVRAFEDVAMATSGAFLAISQRGKRTADRSARIDAHVRIPALVVGTSSTQEVETGRHSFRLGFV